MILALEYISLWQILAFSICSQISSAYDKMLTNVVFKHLNECIGVQHMFEFVKLNPSLLTNNIIHDEFDLRSSRVNLVQMNTRIIDRHKKWNVLLFKEPFKVKKIKPTLNTGLKPSMELQLL